MLKKSTKNNNCKTLLFFKVYFIIRWGDVIELDRIKVPYL